MRRLAGTLLGFVLVLGGCDEGGGRAAPRHDSAPPTSAAPEPSPPQPSQTESPADLAPPGSPRETARDLARVEAALRSESTGPDDARIAAFEQQHAYRALSAHPEWLPEVLAALPPDLGPVVTANNDAGELLAGLADPQPSLPDWRIEAPPPPEVLIGFYREAEAASGVPWRYLAAIHFVETRIGRIRGTSTAGAQGPMQFIPATWEAYGQGDINDNRDAILAAGRYLDARGAPEDMGRALYSYNNSLRYVAAIEAYAGVILAHERAYLGYYHWQVYYATVDGVALLPEGYPERPAVFTRPG
jgi:hypothetical protein